MDEEGGEEEMEWLMEELEAPPTSSSSSSQRGRSNHGNGHITTKRVNTDGLRSFSLDDQDDDSEDEVLSVPGVRVVKSSGLSRQSAAHRSAFLQVSVAGPGGGGGGGVTCPQSLTGVSFQEESDEDLVGLLEESDRKRKSSKPRSSGLNSTAANRKRDEDDSDEDLLRV